MVCVSVFYPNDPGKKFDHDYYAASHMPMVMDRLKSSGMVRYEIDRGVGGGAPGAPAPFVCVGRLYFNTTEGFQDGLTAHGPEILADVPKYTDISPQIQLSETAASS
ncbi:MAG: EthD family reductase [Bryobacteraceae bacterium]|jgi:uncharacterized protein (TIGR02118 family)